jgi:RNA polymerase sigma-70 factor (ECF subfamily)
MEPLSQQPAFGQIIDELSGPLLRYLMRCVGDRALAEDLFQETSVRIAHGLPSFEGRARLKTWAFSIATRVIADHFRQPANRVQIVDVDESEATPDTGGSVENRLLIDEMSACVRQVIDSLPEDYRTALVLHDLEGLTAVQTAEICGCSVATAKIRIHRARLRLSEALKQKCEFYRDSDNVLRCDRKR